MYGGVKSGSKEEIITFQHRLDNRSTTLNSQLGPTPLTGVSIAEVFVVPADVENVDVVENLLQDGGHTMPPTSLGRPAERAAVKGRPPSATRVRIEFASQGRHSQSSDWREKLLPFGEGKIFRNEV